MGAIRWWAEAPELLCTEARHTNFHASFHAHFHTDGQYGNNSYTYNHFDPNSAHTNIDPHAYADGYAYRYALGYGHAMRTQLYGCTTHPHLLRVRTLLI